MEVTDTADGRAENAGGPSDLPDQPSGRPRTDEPLPAPGELKLKERRTWKTWQLAAGMLVAALVGMALNYNSSAASSSGSRSSGGSTGAYKLPPQAGTGSAAPTTTAPSTVPPVTSSTGHRTHGAASPGVAHNHGSVASTTTAPAVTTTTGSASSTTAPAAGPLQLLVPATQKQGNWTSPAFSITAVPWDIGWAFQCTPAPASGPSIQIFVAPAGGKPSSTPTVTETGASGQQVTKVSSTGSQVIVVQAPANCVWAVKVTGS